MHKELAEAESGSSKLMSGYIHKLKTPANRKQKSRGGDSTPYFQILQAPKNLSLKPNNDLGAITVGKEAAFGAYYIEDPTYSVENDLSHNTNANVEATGGGGGEWMPQGHSRQMVDVKGDAVPIVRRRRWRRRSAPELRELLQQEEPTRRVSQYDLTLTHKWDLGGRQPIVIDSADDYEDVPSLLWGEDAYRHYKLLTMIETREKIQQIKSAKAAVIRKYLKQHRTLQNIVDVAKAYYTDPTDENRRVWKRLRREIEHSKDHSITDLRHRLSQIPNFLPVFTVILMLAHVLSLVVMCVVGKLAPLGVLSQKEVRRGIQTFLGAETIYKYTIPNPWIGPPITTFLDAGASFAPCMRQDHEVEGLGRAEKYRRLDNVHFGCCQMRGPINAAGTTTLEECRNFTNNAGTWGPPHCRLRPSGENNVAQVIRPCCVDHVGNCRMLSHEHCSFLGGIFHSSKEHCVEVFCLRDICAIGPNLFLLDPDPDMPWLAKSDTVWQWWRFPLALTYTWGLMHCVPLLLLQWLLMKPLEQSAGWFRVMITFTLSGVLGQLTAACIQPEIPHLGSTSGMAGMVGEAAVELTTAWTLLDRPWREAGKLLTCLLVLLVMGLLPYVSLLGSLAGFACGAICALVFMPYITFSWWGRCKKTGVVMIGLLLLAIAHFTMLYTFAQLQPHDCDFCRKVECLSFTDNMCNRWDLLG